MINPIAGQKPSSMHSICVRCESVWCVNAASICASCRKTKCKCGVEFDMTRTKTSCPRCRKTAAINTKNLSCEFNGI